MTISRDGTAEIIKNLRAEGQTSRADYLEQMDAAYWQMRQSLRDMIAIARRDGWRDVTTGRQIVLRAAEAALDAAKVE